MLEKGTRQPLSSVQVYLVDDDTHVSMTDAQGHFVMTVNAPGDFSVGAVGICFVKPMPRKVTLSADRPRTQLSFYLEPAMQLPDVVVYADRDPDKISKRTLSGKTLREVAGSGGDPIRGLQAMPGVAVTNDSNASPAVRGTAPGDNLYYVDSLPVGYLFHKYQHQPAGGKCGDYPCQVQRSPIPQRLQHPAASRPSPESGR